MWGRGMGGRLSRRTSPDLQASLAGRSGCSRRSGSRQRLPASELRSCCGSRPGFSHAGTSGKGAGHGRLSPPSFRSAAPPVTCRSRCPFRQPEAAWRHIACNAPISGIYRLHEQTRIAGADVPHPDRVGGRAAARLRDHDGRRPHFLRPGQAASWHAVRGTRPAQKRRPRRRRARRGGRRQAAPLLPADAHRQPTPRGGSRTAARERERRDIPAQEARCRPVRRHAMTHRSELERRYRRLLTWYPAEHRRANGEEMLGVLLASAPGRQRRPSISDALDLALGGLRIRFRALLAGQFGRNFTDALAVYSIATPVMWTIIQVAFTFVYTYHLVAHGIATSAVLGLVAPISVELIFLILTVAPPVLAWRGRRAAAVAVALIPAAFTTVLAVTPTMTTEFEAANSLLTVLLVVALVISPGPRHGAKVMSRWTWAVVCGAGLAGSVPLYAITSPSMLTGARVPMFAGIAVAAAA